MMTTEFNKQDTNGGIPDWVNHYCYHCVHRGMPQKGIFYCYNGKLRRGKHADTVDIRFFGRRLQGVHVTKRVIARCKLLGIKQTQ